MDPDSSVWIGLGDRLSNIPVRRKSQKIRGTKKRSAEDGAQRGAVALGIFYRSNEARWIQLSMKR